MNTRLKVLFAPDGGDGAGIPIIGNSGDAGTENGANSTEPVVNSGSNAAGDQSLGWRSIAPKEYRDHEILKGYGDTKEFFKGAIEAHEKVNRSARPKDDAPTEKWTAWRKENGIPEAADGYEVANKLEDGTELSEDAVKGFKQLYLENNLSTEAAKGLHEKLLGLISKGAENFGKSAEAMKAEFQKQLEKNAEEAKTQAVSELSTEWGDDYKANIQKADRALRSIAGEDQIKELAKRGFLNDAAVIKVFRNAYNLISEDTLLGGVAPGGSPKERMFPNSPEMYE
jgi:hypothetical protein